MPALTEISKKTARRAVNVVPTVRVLGGTRGIRRTASAVRGASDQAGGAVELAKQVVTSMPAMVVGLSKIARDERVPRRYRVALLAIVPYLVSPIDLVPDFVPVVGQMDDVALVAFVLGWVVRNVDEEVLAEHWSGSPVLLGLLEQVAEHTGPGALRRTRKAG